MFITELAVRENTLIVTNEKDQKFALDLLDEEGRAGEEGREQETPMKTLAIVALCVCSAVIYGIIHDQITARICVEYFTIGHPPVFNTDSPTLLGLGWGVIATWWVGLILGVPLAMVSRLGSRPKRTVGSLIRPLAVLLLIMACCGLLSGAIGYVLARNGQVFLMEPMALLCQWKSMCGLSLIFGHILPATSLGSSVVSF